MLYRRALAAVLFIGVLFYANANGVLQPPVHASEEPPSNVADDRNATGETVHHTKAIDELEKTVQQFTAEFGKHDQRTLMMKVRLANAHSSVRNLERAETLLLSAIHGYNVNRAKQMYHSFGDSSDLGEAWLDLGKVYGTRHWYPEATSAYSSSIRAFTSEMGSTCPQIGSIKAELDRIKSLETAVTN